MERKKSSFEKLKPALLLGLGVILVIAGLFSQYYMKKKRKEEELIEKI